MQLRVGASRQNPDELGDARTLVVRRLVPHLGEFGIDSRRSAAADVLENLASFVVTANRGEVARRVGQELDTYDENDGGDALEGEEEAPTDGRETVVDEGKLQEGGVSSFPRR